MRTKKVKQRKRCKARAFELIYNVPPDTSVEDVFKRLKNKKYGVYKGFGTIHEFTSPKKGEKTHLHIGIVLRQKEITDLYWDQLKDYFSISLDVKLTLTPEGPKESLRLVPYEHGLLENKSPNFDKKLQTYWDYCTDQLKHPGQTIHPPYCTSQWVPKKHEEKDPSGHAIKLIRAGLTVLQLEELIDTPETTEKLFKELLSKYDIYVKMIEKLGEIREAKRQRAEYERMFDTLNKWQKDLFEWWEGQDDREIFAHCDDGNTGKNYFTDVISMRGDTLILQTASCKRIAYAWNPLIHKRIIFDIPRGKMRDLDTTVIEKLKNGTLFSTMHHPKLKKSRFKPKILILGNEEISDNWTSGRLKRSTLKGENWTLLAS